MALQSGFRLPWWQDSTVASFQDGIAACKDADGVEAYLPTYVRRAAIVTVYMGNKMEGTLPAGVSQQDTYRMLDELVDKSDAEDLPQPPPHWEAEGNSGNWSPASKTQLQAQLQQHLKAVMHLCFSKELPTLSPDVVKRVHRILMWGAHDAEGRPIAAGEYRSNAAHSGTGFAYPEASTIPPGVQRIVDSFNNRLPLVSTGELLAEALAAELFYDMIVLHPFENGNGRLCRVLIAYALMLCAKDPFPLPLSNGHKSCHKHYHQVLRYADAHSDRTRLTAHILECRHFCWQNIRINARQYASPS